MLMDRKEVVLGKTLAKEKTVTDCCGYFTQAYTLSQEIDEEHREAASRKDRRKIR
jgi:hypothetical protein